MSGWDQPGRHGEGYFLDVLGGGGEEALTADGEQPPEAGVAVAVKLFGVGKGAFDGLLTALVDAFAPGRKTVSIDTFSGLGPDMADDQSGGAAVRGA